MGYYILATDPRGYKVETSKVIIDRIFENKHPELKQHKLTEEDIKNAIENPDLNIIFLSNIYKNCQVYYRKTDRPTVELKVIVKFDEDNFGELVTAHPSSRRPNGEVAVWKK